MSSREPDPRDPNPFDIFETVMRLVGGDLPAELMRSSILPVPYPEEVMTPAMLPKMLGTAAARLSGSRNVQADPASEDAWALYLGLPQRHGSFEPSPFKPTKARNPATEYLRLTSGGWEKILNSYADIQGKGKPIELILQTLDRPVDMVRVDGKWTQPTGRVPTIQQGDAMDLQALAQFQLSHGRDERGPYIAMYDIWDLNQPLEGVVGTPFEIYDRLYYDPQTFEPIDLHRKKRVPSDPDSTRNLISSAADRVLRLFTTEKVEERRNK